MPNEEVLGTRKTVVVLAIVVGCFAALWPRLLSPLLYGASLPPEPGPLDRPPGCCEVLFEPEVAVLELVRAVCGSAGTPAANECRKALNSTCGLDVAAAIFRPENIGKSAKSLLEALKASNFSCLKENFGVTMWTLAVHPAFNSWILNDTIKQERPGPPVSALHPALRERGRAIPSEIPLMPPRGAPPLPHHARPPPIPGMRPPMGAGAGPQPTPKSSMGFVMPVYTICIIVFFVYTLSKILFKRADSPYEQVTPDPYFRARVFRDRSQGSPDSKVVVSGISGLVEEVHRQMEANYALNRSQDGADHNGQVHRNGNVTKEPSQHVYAAELRGSNKPVSYRETSPDAKELPSEPKELTRSPKEQCLSPKELSPPPKDFTTTYKELSPAPKELSPSPKELSPSPKELSPSPKELSPSPNELSPSPKELSPSPKELSPSPKELSPPPKELSPSPKELSPSPKELSQSPKELSPSPKEISPSPKEFAPSWKEHSLSPKELSSSPEVLDTPKELSTKLKEESLKELIPSPDQFSPSPKELSSSTKEQDPFTNELSPEPIELRTPIKELSPSPKELSPEPNLASSIARVPSIKEKGIIPEIDLIEDDDLEHLELIKLSQSVNIGKETDSIVKMTEDLLREEKQSTPELLEEALREDALKYDIHDEDEDYLENENGSVKAADPVSEIYLQRDIPAESRVLVADFASQSGPLKESPRSPSPLVVSGKMTLSLVQDQPRDTPERDLTVSEWTTADDITSAPENGRNHSTTGQKTNYEEDGEIEDLSEEEVEEEVEVEEIEIEEEEDVEDQNDVAHRKDRNLI